MRRSAMLALVVVMIVPVVLVGGTALAASTCFSDVDDAAWYEPFICWAADNGIVTGYPDGTFRPDRNVSRAEVATITARLAEKMPVVSIAAGSFNEGTSRSVDDTVNPIQVISTEIVAPAAGVLIIQNTSSWDLGEYTIHGWTEVDTLPAAACDAYWDGDSVVGSFGTDGALPSSEGYSRANLAGMAAVPVSAGAHTVHHCLQLFRGTYASNLDHSLVVEWMPTNNVTITPVAVPLGGGGATTPEEGSTSAR
ncbi:MAG: S-layer homology domain-containing protein [Acidimicrobiia bacterium]|nr:S-layer homology domain-containing protein [Acidimicrobiia bacterium]